MENTNIFKKILINISKLLEWLIKNMLNAFMIILFISLFGVITGIYTVNRVDGISMQPTFKDGDITISTRLYDEIKRNDVVIVKHEDEFIIKRVIGVAGDTVSFCDYSTYVNGLPAETNLDNPVIIEETYAVGENEVFVAGDNRVDSYDSRYYGPISLNEIERVVVFHIIISEKPHISLVH